jgi:hypothetical protein
MRRIGWIILGIVLTTIVVFGIFLAIVANQLKDL